MESGRAAWQHDTATVACIACKKKFSLFVRRHHCRGCGGVFCAKCCDFKVKGVKGYAKGDSQRVCSRCFGLASSNQSALGGVGVGGGNFAGDSSRGGGGGGGAGGGSRQQGVGPSLSGGIAGATAASKKSLRGPKARQRRVLIIGTEGVGKSSIIYRYARNTMPPAVGADDDGYTLVDGASAYDSQSTFVPSTMASGGGGGGQQQRGRSRSIASAATTATNSKSSGGGGGLRFGLQLGGGNNKDKDKGPDSGREGSVGTATNSDRHPHNGGTTTQQQVNAAIDAFIRSLEMTVMDKGQEYCLTFEEATYEPAGEDGGGGGAGGSAAGGGGGAPLFGMGGGGGDGMQFVGGMANWGSPFSPSSAGGGANPYGPPYANAYDGYDAVLGPPYQQQQQSYGNSRGFYGDGGAVAIGGGGLGGLGGEQSVAGPLTADGGVGAGTNNTNPNGTNMSGNHNGGAKRAVTGFDPRWAIGVHAIIIVYAVDDQQSLLALHQLREEMLLCGLTTPPYDRALYGGYAGQSNDVVTVLVGNKSDVSVSNREVEPSDAASLARAWGISHYELSAKYPNYAAVGGSHKGQAHAPAAAAMGMGLLASPTGANGNGGADLILGGGAGGPLMMGAGGPSAGVVGVGGSHLATLMGSGGGLVSPLMMGSGGGLAGGAGGVLPMMMGGGLSGLHQPPSPFIGSSATAGSVNGGGGGHLGVDGSRAPIPPMMGGSPSGASPQQQQGVAGGPGAAGPGDAQGIGQAIAPTVAGAGGLAGGAGPAAANSANSSVGIDPFILSAALQLQMSQFPPGTVITAGGGVAGVGSILPPSAAGSGGGGGGAGGGAGGGGGGGAPKDGAAAVGDYLQVSGLFFEPRLAAAEDCVNPTVDDVFQYLKGEFGRKDGT